MKKSEAIKIVNRLAFSVAKIRSNMIEGLYGFGSSWDTVPEPERRVLRTLYPALFPEKGYVSIVEYISRLQEQGEELSPSGFYNLLFIIEKEGNIAPLIAMFDLNSEKLPSINPPPAWIMGWEPKDEG